MSEPLHSRLEPAIGLLEFESIAAGIVAGDAMVKSSPVSSLYAGTIHPGRYLVLVGGDTAAVEIALDAGGSETVVDSLFLAEVHPAVITAIAATASGATVDGDALGVIETASVAAAVVAADAGCKAADVSLRALRLADHLGGKAYCLFTGVVADVEVAIETAAAVVEPGGNLVRATVVAQLHDEMRDNIAADLGFNNHLRRRGGAS